MTCTAKCLGDNACITGCFAKYGNAPMNDLLECSIEKNSCIKVAILPTGPDSATEAPAPPLVPVANFDQKTLEGTWYKVMGWNDRYDCFDCQKNSFASAGRDKLAVDVEFSMPRPPAGAYPCA
ncbi:VDE lipocalin domain-containing protein [Aureococcus anophagefferens]|nr:VDE lipocalin domain-containing protein [Aureococcus anophagefferens]